MRLGGGLNAQGKKASKRPDLVALSRMQTEGSALSQRQRVGAVPGIPIGRRFYGRAELSAVGLHGHWLSGADPCKPLRTPASEQRALEHWLRRG